MKKLLAVAALAATLPLSNVAMADADIGCGLGTMVFDGKSGKVFKILGATTNGTSGNQTFGISFGTLGCDGNGTINSAQKLALFIDGNMDNLARDIAKGEGETLATLSEVWGVQASDKEAFNELAQENFAEVFKSENVTSEEVFANLNTLVAADATLAGYAI
ncbi:DUF3015 domain-containing protein [Vibrio renipiscarius]|uniref:Signal peptide protein n=1 Tax=Vibrio renipiscarius TaxID=1461322 RepID=A0A0C2JVE3_9VIBR|nr:DUF3015 domain-containing protein [Vibrio renipiscarius]KII75611.1 signal peptide protein [Vibrio renipiscarius]KII81939.1 signal peptide protein [Vibrio renipiscarius]